MDAFLSFFENLTSAQKFIWIFACLTIGWLAETSIPLFRFNYKKWNHAGKNLVFLATSILINLLFTFATVSVFTWGNEAHVGFLNWLDLPTWAALLVSIMWLDFIAQYVAHILLHKYKWMWKFHMVHHSDTRVDVTTGTRHHPGDYFIREVFSLLAVITSGMPVAFYLFYRISSVFFTYFTHANIAMPLWLDKTISWLFVSPNMHKFHHHHERPWTDTNYGNIFSIWDRLFGTFVYDDPKKIHYGLDVLPNETADDVLFQFKIPFNPEITTDY